MSSKLSVEEVLATLEERAAFLRGQEAFHAEQEELHRAQRALHAAELGKVLESLEAFRQVAGAAVDLARTHAAPSPPPIVEEKLPPGRLQVSRLIRLAVESPGLPEPFGPKAVAAEANRRFRNHLKKPIGTRAVSDVLRRMLAEGKIRLAREGGASQEALYIRKG